MVVKCSVTTHASAQHQQNAHRKSPRCLSLVRGLPRVSKFPNSIEPSRARGAGQGARRGAVLCLSVESTPRYRQRPSTCLPACFCVGWGFHLSVAPVGSCLPAWFLISRLASSGRTNARIRNDNVIGHVGGWEARQVRMGGGFIVLRFGGRQSMELLL